MSKFAEKYTGVYNPRLKERDEYWDMLKAERETEMSFDEMVEREKRNVRRRLEEKFGPIKKD
jgi:predicted nucleotidyltransferase